MHNIVAKIMRREKIMANKNFLWGIAACSLLLGAVFAGCDNGTTDDDGTSGNTTGYQAAGLYVNDETTPKANITGLVNALAWIKNNAEDDGSYVIVLGADETVAGQTLNAAAVNSKTGVIITLTGLGEERTIQLSGTGILFNITTAVELVLDKNITLKGIASNSINALVKLNLAGAKLKMLDGAKITGNKANSGSSGGGVYAYIGDFTMSGGEISGNEAGFGGGVAVGTNGTFTMTGGKISSNESSYNGGGVYNNGTFTISGGEISGNTASFSGTGGGGVYTVGTLTMNGGEILGNASKGTGYSGGGVYVYNGTFTKNGGVIYGYTAGNEKSNKVTTTSGILVSSKGHAVYVNSTKRCESTVSAEHNLDSTKTNADGGGWD
jgi:hypothetical protein